MKIGINLKYINPFILLKGLGVVPFFIYEAPLIPCIIIVIILFSACQSSLRYTSGITSSSIGNASDKVDADKPFYKYEPMDNTQAALLSEAKRWIGTPYCYGGYTKSCTDCSGFVQKVYEKIGISLPRTAAEQFSAGRHVNDEERQPGDLIFFSNGSGISHVGIYAGNDEFIHAATSLGVTRQSIYDNYFKTRFAGYRRFLPNA